MAKYRIKVEQWGDLRPLYYPQVRLFGFLWVKMREMRRYSAALGARYDCHRNEIVLFENLYQAEAYLRRHIAPPKPKAEPELRVTHVVFDPTNGRCVTGNKPL